MRMMNSEIARIKGMREDELFEAAKQLQKMVLFSAEQMRGDVIILNMQKM